ncbi:MAG: type IV pilus assembly protein PilM [Actinobacteria bacterium]|nr:type IV pilus assembly protein PilM [Actinomycetota bacterium]
MARRGAIGLDIGTHAVHVAQVSRERGQPVTTNFGGVTLPRGAVREAEIVERDTVTAAVRQLWSDAGLREKRVHLGVSNQRVVVRQIDLPYMEERELRSALRFQVQEYIPIPVEEAELDFQRLEEFTGEGGARMMRILLVAAQRESIGDHVAVVEGAGLRPVGVDLNAFAVLRAVVPDPETATGAEMVVDIGAGVTNIIVHERGIPRFVRILVLGGGDITDALGTSLGVSTEDAEATKMQAGLTGGDATAVQVIEDRVNQFVDEVRGSLDYFLAQTGAAQVTRVMISGGGSKLPGLADRLSTALRVPVDRGRPFEAAPARGSAYGPDQLREVEPLLATAIGLGLGGLE